MGDMHDMMQGMGTPAMDGSQDMMAMGDGHMGHDMHTMDMGDGNTMDPGHDHDMGTDHSSMMMMYFHCSDTATVLFKGWNVSSPGAWVGTCITIFLMAMLYEGLKVFREYLLRKAAVNVRYQSTEVSKDSTTVLMETHSAGQSRLLSWAHFLQTGLHMIQVTVSYFLMLIFMTYNVYLCIPIIVGAGAGYFAFGWKRSIIVDVNEHCH